MIRFSDLELFEILEIHLLMASHGNTLTDDIFGSDSDDADASSQEGGTGRRPVLVPDMDVLSYRTVLSYQSMSV